MIVLGAGIAILSVISIFLLLENSELRSKINHLNNIIALATKLLNEERKENNKLIKTLKEELDGRS